MRHFFIILALTLASITLFSQQSVAQKVTEEYCLKEQKQTKKIRDSIIRTYTKGKRAVSIATAARMATNIEIAVTMQCEAALKRKLSISKYRKESDIILLNVARNSVQDEHFDLADSTLAEHFFKQVSDAMVKGAK